MRKYMINNLQKLRMWRNLTQQQLAKKSYCSVGIIREIETTDYFPKYIKRQSIAEALNVNQDNIWDSEVYYK